jgi:hypothetical protein
MAAAGMQNLKNIFERQAMKALFLPLKTYEHIEEIRRKIFDALLGTVSEVRNNIMCMAETDGWRVLRVTKHWKKYIHEAHV